MSGTRKSKLDRDIDQAIRTNALAWYHTHTLAAKLEKAAVAMSWKGSQPPGDWAKITQDLANARADLEAFVKSLLPKEPEA